MLTIDLNNIPVDRIIVVTATMRLRLHLLHDMTVLFYNLIALETWISPVFVKILACQVILRRNQT